MTFEVDHPGSMLDYNRAHMSVPVVSRRAAVVLESTCGDQVQLIEVAIAGQREPFFIANSLRIAECVDERLRWASGSSPKRTASPTRSANTVHRPPPDRSGARARLDFFRVARFPVSLIVSERLKRAMEDAKLIGPKFVPV